MNVTKRDEVVVGVFTTAGDARRAIDELRDAGFSDRSVGVLTHDRDGDSDVRSIRDLERSTKDETGSVGPGAAVGAVAGAGGGALWALAIAAGVLPAIGPVVAGGLLAALAASAAGGAAVGAVVGALAGLGVGREEASYYEEEFKKGRTIVVVKTTDRAIQARSIFLKHGSVSRYAQPQARPQVARHA